MRHSAEPLGGQDPITGWLVGYLFERCIFGMLIPSLVGGITLLSLKMKSMPAVRIVFPGGFHIIFFVGLPKLSSMRFESYILGSDRTKMDNISIQPKGATFCPLCYIVNKKKILYKIRSKLPQMELISF